MKYIPNSLKKYRRVRGLKQKDVAAILGVRDAAMISRWEKGVSLPNALNLFKLSAVYRITPDAFYVDFILSLKDEIRGREEALLRR